MTVAGTILQQLGGLRFQTMTGARDFVASDRRLSFRIPKAKDGINHITITLDESDTYTLTFARLRGLTFTEVCKVSMIYVDRLRSVFTEHTGLHCTL
jgi:hypothetical protein